MKTKLGVVGCLVNRLVRPHAFIAPRGWAEPDGEYLSRYNFVWWFWLPRIHTQRPDTMNPRVIRLIWLCFAVGLDIYGPESRMYWPNVRDQGHLPAEETSTNRTDEIGG
jgi:hypothetical protein